MAELGLAAAPVPSITVTFLSTVDSARAGALAATKAATAAPNFTTRISKLPRAPHVRSSLRHRTRKKNSKSASLHCGMSRIRDNNKDAALPFGRAASRCRLIPPYPVPIAHNYSARVLRSCADNVLILVVSSTPVGGLLPP